MSINNPLGLKKHYRFKDNIIKPQFYYIEALHFTGMLARYLSFQIVRCLRCQAFQAT